MAAHQAPPSLRFSRQKHWSGLPFPSPMHESEKWKWSRSVISDSVTPWTVAYQAPLSMGFSRQESWSGVPLPSLEDQLVTNKLVTHLGTAFFWWAQNMVTTWDSLSCDSQLQIIDCAYSTLKHRNNSLINRNNNNQANCLFWLKCKSASISITSLNIYQQHAYTECRWRYYYSECYS